MIFIYKYTVMLQVIYLIRIELSTQRVNYGLQNINIIYRKQKKLNNKLFLIIENGC